jgi:hypothetical protein
VPLAVGRVSAARTTFGVVNPRLVTSCDSPLAEQRRREETASGHASCPLPDSPSISDVALPIRRIGNRPRYETGTS